MRASLTAPLNTGSITADVTGGEVNTSPLPRVSYRPSPESRQVWCMVCPSLLPYHEHKSLLLLLLMLLLLLITSTHNTASLHGTVLIRRPKEVVVAIITLPALPPPFTLVLSGGGGGIQQCASNKAYPSLSGRRSLSWEETQE